MRKIPTLFALAGWSIGRRVTACKWMVALIVFVAAVVLTREI